MSERIVGGVISERNLVGVLIGLLEQGDIDSACQLYEEGGRAVSLQLAATLQKADAELREAGVRMYAQARDFAQAAALYEHARYWPDAAKMYEEAGDSLAAARCWRKAGEPKRAARALDAAGANEEAAQLYEEIGERDAKGASLARGSKWLDAAKAWRDSGNTRAEMDILKQVPLDHPDRVPAVKRLAEILRKRNRANEAAQLVTDVMRDNDAGRTDIELHDLMAELFEQLGQASHAERLRVRAQRLRARAGQTAAEPAAPAEEGVTEPHDTEETPPVARAAPVQEGYQFLKRIPIFGRLSLGDMRDLYRLASEKTFMPGEIIVESQQDAPGLFVFVAGDAEVYAVGEGDLRHLNSIGPGATVGEISLVSKALTSARVTAATEVRALLIEREQFELYLISHPSAALRIYQLFCEGLAERVRTLSRI